MNDYIDFAALGKVVSISLLLGAGIPLIFALGVRALAPVEGSTTRSPARLTVATLCFAVCLAAVVFGVYRLIATGGH